MRPVNRIVIVALLLGLSAAPAAAAPALEPLVRGWEQFFKLSWEASARRGEPVVSGYIANESGFTAARIRLLVEGLDPSGQVVSQRLGWVAHPVAPSTRTYFEVPVGSSAPSYRVSVFAFDWLLGRD